jgi:CRISPR-associated protein (TIGR03984 family)
MSTNDQTQSLQTPEDDKKVVAWLTGHAKEHSFLLAFADDGVIWGKSENEKWITSYDAFGKPFSELRGETLLEAFAFGESDQVHLYRDGEKWIANRVVDAGEMVVESQLLWGDEAIKIQKGFTHLHDKVQQSMDQALPLTVKDEELITKAPRLTIHHFIETDENTGEARIFLSRLVKLELGSLDE